MRFQSLHEIQSYLEEGDPVFRMLEAKIRGIKDGEAVVEVPYKFEITRRGGVLNGDDNDYHGLHGWYRRCQY